jgi:hypothetical protein
VFGPGVSSKSDTKLYAISVDPNQNIIVGGVSYANTLVKGANTPIIAYFNSAGERKWSKQFPSDTHDYVSDIIFVDSDTKALYTKSRFPQDKNIAIGLISIASGTHIAAL